MIDVSSTNEAWLSRFFSGRNELRWEKLNSAEAPSNWISEIKGWISLLETGAENTPICLPCLAKDGSVQWYAGAQNILGSLALADELQAFFGPSYAVFDGRPHKLNSSDPLEAALKDIFVEPIYRIEAIESKQVTDLSQVFILYQTLLKRRPSSLKPATRPFGIARGLFDRALLAGNENDARSLLEEMARSGRLTAENKKFLEVRLLAGLGLWDQIVLQSNLLKDLTDFQLPPRVVRDVSEAYYRFYIQPFDEHGGLNECLDRLRASSLPGFDRLFSQRYGIQHPAVTKVFLLRQMLQVPTDIVYSRALLSDLANQDQTPLTDEILAVLEEKEQSSAFLTPPQDLRTQADSAFEDDDYDRALSLYLVVPADSKTILRAITCARFAADKKTAQKVVDFVEASGNVDLDERSKSALSALEEQARPIPLADNANRTKVSPTLLSVTGWLRWAAWVADGIGQDEALDTLRKHSSAWSTEELYCEPQKMDEFANFLSNGDAAVEQTFRSAFDEIFSAFIIDLDKPPSTLKPLYKCLLFLLATSQSVTKDDLSLTAQLSSNLLAFGLTESEYGEVLVLLSDLFEGHLSLNSLDWALDVIELLVLERCQNEEARLRLFTDVSSFAQQSAHRITESQRRALKELYIDFEVEFPTKLEKPFSSEADGEDNQLSERLAGKRIAIYTLTEPAGKRAADKLKEIAPGSEVILNSDHECTERLSVLAKSADIFVFAWKSSKHQAYYCIKNNRSKELPLLQPLGKGSASIIREILDYV